MDGWKWEQTSRTGGNKKRYEFSSFGSGRRRRGVGTRNDSVKILFEFLFLFYAEGHRGQFWHGEGRQLFDVVHPAFPRQTSTWPTLQGALKDGLGEAVCPQRHGQGSALGLPTLRRCSSTTVPSTISLVMRRVYCDRQRAEDYFNAPESVVH